MAADAQIVRSATSAIKNKTSKGLAQMSKIMLRQSLLIQGTPCHVKNGGAFCIFYSDL